MPAPARMSPVLEGTYIVRGLRTSAVIAGVAALALTLSACGSKSNGGGNTSCRPGRERSRPAATQSSSSSCRRHQRARRSTPAWCSTPAASTTSRSTSRRGRACTAAKAEPEHQDLLRAVELAATTTRRTCNAEVSKGCDPVIAVGGLMIGNVKAVAKANPKVHFAEVDAPSQRPERLRPPVQHRAGRLPRRLPRRRHDQDRQGRDLGRPEHPAGDDLHGRLLGGRAVLQQAEAQERPGARLGREEPEGRHLLAVRSPTRTRASRSARRSSSRAPTSSSRSPAAPASGAVRRRRRPAARPT